MDLASHQRHLRNLIKGRNSPPETDPYVDAVAASPGLDMVREIVVWWRTFGVERSCALTTAALKRRGRLGEAVQDYIREHTISPYIEELRDGFLATMSTDDDPLVAAVARFEAALGAVKRGDPATHVVEWSHNPAPLLQALIEGGPLDEDRLQGHYQTVVSNTLPNLVQIVAVTDT